MLNYLLCNQSVGSLTNKLELLLAQVFEAEENEMIVKMKNVYVDDLKFTASHN